MKTKLKILFCALLAALSMLCMAATLANIGVLDVSAAGESGYLVTAREGCACICRLPDSENPVLVSGLHIASLSAAERAALTLGIPAETYADALETLENLGA